MNTYFLWIKCRVKLPGFVIYTMHCTHIYMLTNATIAKSVLTFEISVIPRQKYTFFKGKFSEEFIYATNFDGKMGR